MKTAGRWPWKSESAKECVTTHLPNGSAPKMDGVYRAAYTRPFMHNMYERVGGRTGCSKVSVQIEMERPAVQILVVVANIQMRTLKTEVGNGSMSTVIGHGLVGPKERLNRENFKLALSGAVSLEIFPKGKTVNIPLPRRGCLWQHVGTSGRLSVPREEFSFLPYDRTSLK